MSEENDTHLVTGRPFKTLTLTLNRNGDRENNGKFEQALITVSVSYLCRSFRKQHFADNAVVARPNVVLFESKCTFHLF